MFPKWPSMSWDMSSWYSLLSPLQVTIVIVGCIHRCWSLLLLLMISQMFPKPPYSSRNLSSWYGLLSHLQVIIVGIVECMPLLLIIIVVVVVKVLLTCCCQWFLQCFPNGLHCHGTGVLIWFLVLFTSYLLLALLSGVWGVIIFASKEWEDREAARLPSWTDWTLYKRSGRQQILKKNRCMPNVR